MRKGNLKVIFVFIFLLGFVYGHAQNLQPVCQNFNTTDYIEDQEFHCGVADNRGTVYFGTNFGVLVYKGERKAKAKGWDFLLLPDADIIYSLYLDTVQNRLYVGGEKELGYFELSNYYTGKYVSLNHLRSGEIKNTQVWHINSVNGKLVFHTIKGLLVYDNNKFEILPAPADAIFHNVFEYQPGKLLINTITKGWHVYDGKLTALKGSELLPQDKCYGVLGSMQPEHYLLFYRNSGVYNVWLQDKSISNVKKVSSDSFDQFLSETQVYSTIYSGRIDYLLLGTLNKGTFIVKNTEIPGPEYFDTKNIISETSPATNIKSTLGFFADKKKNVWVLGKTNLSILPADISMYYSELAGVTVQNICSTSDRVYIIAKNGLYKLNTKDGVSAAPVKVSAEICKKGECIGDTLVCIRDYGVDIYYKESLKKIESDYFINDFCIQENITWLATEDGIRKYDAIENSVALGGENILQLLFFKNQFYVVTENKVMVLDKQFKTIATIPFGNQFKTINLAKLFVLNNQVALRNIDNTFIVSASSLQPIDPESVRKIWSHRTFPGNKFISEYNFEYDDQNNTYLYITTGEGTMLANSFRSSVEINDIIPFEGSFLVGSKSGLFLSPLHMRKKKEQVNIFDFRTDSTHYDLDGDIIIPYANSKNIEVSFAVSGFYNKFDNTAYRYRLIGFDSTWKEFYLTQLQLSNLPPGRYTLEVKSIYGNSLETDISTIGFTISKPWWATWWAILLLVIVVLLVIYAIVQLSVYRLKQSKIKLEKIVTERTQEIAMQKDEIEHKNKEITDSINYAKRIQSALLTDENYLLENFPKAFILYMPKDIVSGDYYWFNNINGIECIVVADCTGHGVPGAFMSMLGVSKLNEIKAEKVNSPDQILSRLNLLIFETLGQGKPNTDSRDGMDIAVITIDQKNNKLRYAGANRSLVIVNRETNQLEEIKATKLPVGGSQYGPDRTYQLHELDIKPNTSFFLTTDGYADQFGGPAGKKFMTKKLNELFVQISGMPSAAQKQQLIDNYLTWRSNVEQVDDVCVFGINF